MNEIVITADMLRRDEAPMPREKCRICGRHSELSQKHHIFPLELVAQLYNSYRYDASDIHGRPIVWLCPTHHQYVHSVEFDGREAFIKHTNHMTDIELSRTLLLFDLVRSVTDEIISGLEAHEPIELPKDQIDGLIARGECARRLINFRVSIEYACHYLSGRAERRDKALPT